MALWVKKILSDMCFDLEKDLKLCAAKVTEALEACYPGDPVSAEIFEAEKYSLLVGGKRIRPYLVFSFSRLFEGNDEAALIAACAIEMIHTYSLIHDDLPCMDNDDYRRGRLTNHKVYGEDVAVLAGDALLTRAFETVAASAALSPLQKSKMVLLLAQAAGDCGMIGGQMLDIKAPKTDIHDMDYLVQMHRMKTGALIRAAAKLGCVAAGKEDDSRIMAAADLYASNIGLAFQIVDDVLDVTGDAQELGKNTGVDSQANKLTFLNFYSVDEAMVYASQLTQQAIDAISIYDHDGRLRGLAEYLLKRTH